MLYRLVTNYSG